MILPESNEKFNSMINIIETEENIFDNVLKESSQQKEELKNDIQKNIDNKDFLKLIDYNKQNSNHKNISTIDDEEIDMILTNIRYDDPYFQFIKNIIPEYFNRENTQGFKNKILEIKKSKKIIREDGTFFVLQKEFCKILFSEVENKITKEQQENIGTLIDSSELGKILESINASVKYFSAFFIFNEKVQDKYFIGESLEGEQYLKIKVFSNNDLKNIRNEK